MTVEEKLSMLEEMLEMDEGTLKPEMTMDDLENWDSVTALSLIVLLDENFSKSISGKEIKALKTVDDILKYME